MRQSVGPGSSGSSLRTVHKIFIASASLMALVLVGWGFSVYRSKEELSALAVAAIGGALFVVLATYGLRFGRTTS